MEKYLIAQFETQAREPVIRKMKDGSIICTFLCGKTEPLNDNFVAISRSFDDGKTWSEPEKLFSHNARGVWCTEIFTEFEYPIAAVHTYNADCIYLELTTHWSETRDNGKTWSTPKSFLGSINGCSIRQGITLSNGDVLFPLYWQSAVKGFDWSIKDEVDTIFISGVGILPKGEKHWQRYGCITLEGTFFWEPNAVELENGHIIMYLRNDSGFIYYTESFDYGRTWSEPIKSNIPHSDAKISCLKLNGKIIMLNNAIASGRTHLEISVSEDGKNFKHIRYIEEENANFFYPHAFADMDENMLYVSYENMKQHYLAKFTFTELGL